MLYCVSLALAYLLMRQPPVTGEFPEKVARRFNVLQTTGSSTDPSHRSISLSALRKQNPPAGNVRYRLQVTELRLEESDISRVRVLEHHQDWQLIEFHYANTHTSISVYRAFDDRIEPLSFQITSHVGMGFAAVALFFVVGVLSLIIGTVWRWRARRRVAVNSGPRRS